GRALRGKHQRSWLRWHHVELPVMSARGRRAGVSSAVLTLGFAIAGSGCAPPSLPMGGPYTVVGGDPRRPADIPSIGQAEWTLSRERLLRMRSELPQRPYAARVQIGVVDPRSGKVFQARGAVAVSPDHAARLILVGPAGATALDLWVTRDRFRFSIPS